MVVNLIGQRAYNCLISNQCIGVLGLIQFPYPNQVNVMWLSVIGEKYKYRAALCLVALFGTSLLGMYFIRVNVNAADQTVKSLYRDRLVPAQDISEVQEKLYQNELLLQEHISAPAADAQLVVVHQIRRHGAEVDSLVDKFAHTLLVNKEVESLKKYRSYLAMHRRTQGQILDLSERGAKQEAAALYRNEGQWHFEQLMGTVHQLSSLQTSVGHELYDQSHRNLLEAGLLSYLVIGLTIMVCLLAQALLKWFRVTSRLPYKPGLN